MSTSPPGGWRGLGVIGSSLVLDGKIVGAAVAGYVLVDFSQPSEIQRVAKNARIDFERVWRVAREQSPVSQPRLNVNGELLKVLGDALLRENSRTREYEHIAAELQETARAKEQVNSDLRETASVLRESEERYRTLFDLGPIAVYSVDASGLTRDYNHVAVELWGRQPKLGIPTSVGAVRSKCFAPMGLSCLTSIARWRRLFLGSPAGSPFLFVSLRAESANHKCLHHRAGN